MMDTFCPMTFDAAAEEDGITTGYCRDVECEWWVVLEAGKPEGHCAIHYLPLVLMNIQARL